MMANEQEPEEIALSIETVKKGPKPPPMVWFVADLSLLNPYQEETLTTSDFQLLTNHVDSRKTVGE